MAISGVSRLSRRWYLFYGKCMFLKSQKLSCVCLQIHITWYIVHFACFWRRIDQGTARNWCLSVCNLSSYTYLILEKDFHINKFHCLNPDLTPGNSEEITYISRIKLHTPETCLVHSQKSWKTKRACTTQQLCN